MKYIPIIFFIITKQMDIQGQKQRKIPKHYREYKYQQNRQPISEEKAAEKALKREAKNQEHKNILEEYKKNHRYYDEEADQWNKQKYYQHISSIPSYDQLHELLSSSFHHAKRRQNIFPIIDRHPDYTLRCVYSGKILSDSEGNFLEKCDQEHSFPQSYQRGTKSGTGRDMHAIYAASKSANGSRGNTPFGLYSEKQAPVQVDDFGVTYSGSGNKRTYIPKLNSGAVARSTLYVLVCYKGSANSSYLPKQTLNWLIETACKEEVSQWEKHRNQQLHRLQGNRNPFIDHPEWAKLIDFTKGWQ